MKPSRIAKVLLFVAVVLSLIAPAVGRNKGDAWACMEPLLSTVVFSPDGTKLVKTYRFIPDMEWVILLDATTGKKILNFRGGPVVAFLPDGKTLVTVGRRKGGGVTVRLVTLETGAELRNFDVPNEKGESALSPVALSPDGQMLAIGGTREIRLLDVATGKDRGKLEGQKKVTDIVFSPDGQTLFTKWALFAEGQERVEKIEGVTTATRTPPQEIEREINLWDVNSMKILSRFEGDSEVVARTVFSPDGKTLATLAGDRKAIRLWDVSTGKEIRKLEGHKGDITAVAFSPDSKSLAAGYFHKTREGGFGLPSGMGPIFIWDVMTGEMRRELEGHKFWISVLAFSPDGRTLVSGDSGDGIKFWKMDAGKEPQLLTVSAGGSC